MAYAKSSSERYERTEINSSTSYSRSSKSSKSMSSNQEMIGGGHQSIESNQQNRSYDFDDNYINEDERHDSGNHPITIRSFKSPAPNRKNMQSPVKDGYRKVTVSSGSNKIDHFSKSATFSDDDEDDSVFIDDQKTRYIDEVEVVAVDATHQESSGERSFEEMFEQKQEQHHNPQLIKGQLVKFQLNMANPDAHGSDQYHQQNKNIHQKQKTPEIQVEQYYTPPIQRSKNQFDTVNLTISEGSQRQQNMYQQQQSQQQHYHQNQNQQQQQQQQQQRQYPKQNKNQQIYEPVNLLISAEQQNRQQHQQHHQNQQHQQQRQQYQQHTQSQYEMRHDSDGEDQRHRYHPIQVELTHSKNKNNSYSPRDLPDYQPKKRPQNVKVETRSESEYGQSDFEAQTPVEVVYSPMPQRKRVHPKNIPIDITIARDGGHLKEPNSFRVLVSPTPHQNEIGFVPVHRGGSHQVYTVQEQNMSSQYQKDPPKIKPKPRKSYEQEVDPREVYDSFQGIEKDLYGQQQQRMRSMELRQVHAEPVQVQDVYHVTSGNEYHNKYQDQDQQNQTRTMHMSVRSSSQSIKKSKQRTSQQRVDQERRTSVEHQRMESARLKKLQQEEKEVQQRQEEAYQRQQKIEQRKRDEQQRKIKEYEEQKRREHEAEMRRREEIERRRREEEELRRRQEIEMKRREEKTRKREEVERRKREEQEIKIREEEIRRKRVQEEERKMAEQQKMEEIRIKEERMKKKKIQEQEEESFQQQQYQKSLQRSQSQKYFNENQINEVNMSSFPRHLKKKPYVVESVSANNTPNFAHQRKFHQGYSVSASNTPDVSRKSKKSASCYTCEHDEHDGKQRKSSSSFKSNVILGRTEMSERKAAVSQLIRPQSVDVTRQSKTLPRGFGRTKSQEWTTGMGQTNQRGQSYSTTTTTKTKNFSSSSNTAQKFMQQSAKTDSRQMVQRPKSAHEFDKRSKHSYQKYTSKNDKQYSQQPFLDSPKEKYPIQEQQHNETFQPFTQQQLQKGRVVEYRNGSDVRIISGSHVTRDAKYDQANRMKNRDVVKSKAYTRLSRKDQQSADQQQQEKAKIIKQASEPKQNSSKDTYESIKVTAKGGVITLCMEEGEENKIPDSVKNRLTKSVYQHGYNDNAYYQQNQSSQYNYQSSSSQRMNSSDQQQSLQDEQSYQQLGYNYSHDDGRIQSGRYTKSSKKHDSNQTTESVYYTVCTRYFQPYNNDWITNIHRMGKAKVPVQGSHHQKCVFSLHLYDPDREEIIVQKIVPPPHLQGSIYYPSEYNANNSNSGGVFYDENNNIIDSISQVFDDSYEQLNTQQTRLNRSHEQNRRRGNRSYNNDVSLDSDGESRTSSICSNQSDASFKHSKPRLLRKSKEFPGARNEVDNSYQQSYAGNMQQVVY